MLGSMPRRILLIRHCQSQANAEGRIEGKGDSPLSELGREQARRLAAFVADQKIGSATLIASPLVRAATTAAEIAVLCGWTPSHDHRIREGELGWMEDLPYAEVGRHMAERKATVLDSELHGGESLDAVAERLWEALSEAMTGTQDTLVFVTHGYAIHALLRRLDHQLRLALIGNGDVVEVWLEEGALAEPPRHYPLGA
jgi:broad specificity phosphatase PhoE